MEDKTWFSLAAFIVFAVLTVIGFFLTGRPYAINCGEEHHLLCV